MFRSTFLVLGIMLLAFSCSENQLDDLKAYDISDGIQSLQEYDAIVDAKVYPTDKLTTATIAKFRSELIIEGDAALGGYIADIERELSEDDFTTFMKIILGQHSKEYDQTKTKEEGLLESRCNKWVWLRNRRRNAGGCTFNPNYWCRTCVGHDQ